MASWAFQNPSHRSAWDKCFLRLPPAKPLITNIQSVQMMTCRVAFPDNRRASTAARSSALATDWFLPCRMPALPPSVLSRPPSEKIHAIPKPQRRRRGSVVSAPPLPSVKTYVTTHDVQRAKVLNKEVIGDWQLRVPVAWWETTKPEDEASVGFLSRFFDYSLGFVQVEGCGNARTIINAMKH